MMIARSKPFARFTLPWSGERVPALKEPGWGDLVARSSPHPAAVAHCVRSASTLPLQGGWTACGTLGPDRAQSA